METRSTDTFFPPFDKKWGTNLLSENNALYEVG